MRNEPGEWHGHPLPYNISAHDASLPRAPRLMLVRHPHARLLSAYLGKAVTGRFTVAGWRNGTGFRGFVDAVIRPSETRRMVSEELELLDGKRAKRAWRRHGNIPL